MVERKAVITVYKRVTFVRVHKGIIIILAILDSSLQGDNTTVTEKLNDTAEEERKE